MGLNTNFFGSFALDRPLTAEHKAILEDFAEEEHADEDGHPGGSGKPPAVYCQWIPTEDGGGLEWDGVEKFYYYTEWLEYLISHFLTPWGYVLNGTVRFMGITEGIEGTISVQDSKVVMICNESIYRDTA